MTHNGVFAAGTHHPTNCFFTDTPLPHPLDELFAEAAARTVAGARWDGHVIVAVNGHVVWKRREDLRPDDERVFYDGDVRDVLAPDDSRILIPRAECADLPPEPARLKWDE